LYFLLKLMNDARQAIIEKRFKEFKEEFEKNYNMGKESEWIKPKSI
jgi:tRNA-guanine transglycosylase